MVFFGFNGYLVFQKTLANIYEKRQAIEKLVKKVPLSCLGFVKEKHGVELE